MSKKSLSNFPHVPDKNVTHESTSAEHHPRNEKEAIMEPLRHMRSGEASTGIVTNDGSLKDDRAYG
jgi:hypothetical protein